MTRGERITLQILRRLVSYPSLIVLILFAQVSIRSEPADIVFLTGGRTLLGSFEGKQGKTVQFRPRNQELLILQSHEMTGLLLGYPGLPACVSFRSEPSDRDCAMSILAIGQTFLFSNARGQKEVLPKEISELTFQKKEKRLPLIPLLHAGTRVRLDGTDATVVMGGLASAQVQLPTGGHLTFTESDITGGRLFQPDRALIDVAKETWKEDPKLFLPGYAGFRSGKVLEGAAFSSIFLASLLGGIYYHRDAVSIAAKSRGDLIYRIAGIGNYPARYQTQLGNRNAAWGLAMGTLAAHTVRILWLRRWTPGTLELQVQPKSVGIGLAVPISLDDPMSR